MYADFSPDPKHTARFGVEKVLVLEAADAAADAEEVLECARENGAISFDADGDELFWVVFSGEPKRVWDMTEKVLRNSLTKLLAV